MKKEEIEKLEKLAELEHLQWMEWAKNIIKKENISKERVERWKQYFIPYSDLPETIKELDRNYARKIINFLK